MSNGYFPTGLLPYPATPVVDGDTIYADHITRLYDEFSGVEVTLGTGVQGSFSTVRDRIKYIETGYVIGPTSSASTAIPIFQGTTGKTLSASSFLIGGSNIIMPNGAAITTTGAYPELSFNFGHPTLGNTVLLLGDSISPATSGGANLGAQTFPWATGYFNQLVISSGLSAPAHKEGAVFYDSTDHTLAYYNDAANVTVNLGQEQLVRVRNNTGATITNGTAVNINGALGNRPTVHKAIANTFADHTFIGIATDDILDGNDGYITAAGIVHSVNTASIGVSGVSAGSQLYLSPTVSGNLTATRPTYPNFVVPIGFITKVAGNNIDILVSPAPPATLGFDGANTVLGTNAAGTAEEYKLISGVNNITVVHTSGLISVSGSLTPTFTTVTANQFATVLYTGVYTTGSININWGNGSTQSLDFTGSASGVAQLILTNGIPGSSYVLTTKQNASGTISLDWAGDFVWQGGVSGAMTSTSGAYDLYSFVYDGYRWFGTFANNFY